MRRHIFLAVSVFSLVLCVASIALWIRSHFVQDTLYVYRSHTGSSRFYKLDNRLFSIQGQVVWKIATYSEPPQMAAADQKSRSETGQKDFVWHPTSIDGYYFNRATRHDPIWTRVGFRYSYWSGSSPFPPFGQINQQFIEFGVPHWFLATTTLPLPAMFCWQLHRRRHRMPGLCPTCGYDLRASKERCPECGKPIVAVNSDESDRTQT